MTTQWDGELAKLLNDLSGAQHDLLELLIEKRNLLVHADAAGLAALEGREAQLVVRLQACHEERGRLLEQAQSEGLPGASIRELAQALPRSQRLPLDKKVQEASARARLLQHHSLTNWVVVQRSLLHLSQMLEIIATGGRQHPTYGKDEAPRASGALVDQAA